MRRESEGVLTSKDLTQVLVDFEPVRQEAKREKEDGKAEEEKSHKHTRGEPDLAGKRRDEVVQRKSVTGIKKIVSTSRTESAVRNKASLRTLYGLAIRG